MFLLGCLGRVMIQGHVWAMTLKLVWPFHHFRICM